MRDNVKLNQDIEVTTSSPDDKRLTKRWGYISAYPHEFLIHFRGGQFRKTSSGQGASCFKYLRDMVFIIPTSLKEIVFQANQLSSDNVDLKIRGMAVYHINNPLKIYTLLNFSNRQKAEEKLAGIIGDLCRSTAKWLIANMKVEECMRKRKEEIADALKKEVSLVVSDPEKGWGVEIMTIGIQDIYIQDDEIFKAMQISFKTEKIRESELTQLEMMRNIQIKRLENERLLAEYYKDNELEKARIEAELKDEKIKLTQRNEQKEFELKSFRLEENERFECKQQEQKIVREKQAKLLRIEMERALAEQERTNELEKLNNTHFIEKEKINLTHEQEESQFALDRYRLEQNEALANYKHSQTLDRQRQETKLQLEIVQQETEGQRITHAEELTALQQRIAAENQLTPAALEHLFIEHALPDIARTLAQSMNNARISIIQQDGQGGTPFRLILTELTQILRERLDAVVPSVPPTNNSESS